jgi:hypothetical protein
VSTKPMKVKGKAPSPAAGGASGSGSKAQVDEAEPPKVQSKQDKAAQLKELEERRRQMKEQLRQVEAQVRATHKARPCTLLHGAWARSHGTPASTRCTHSSPPWAVYLVRHAPPLTPTSSTRAHATRTIMHAHTLAHTDLHARVSVPREGQPARQRAKGAGDPLRAAVRMHPPCCPAGGAALQGCRNRSGATLDRSGSPLTEGRTGPPLKTAFFCPPGGRPFTQVLYTPAALNAQVRRQPHPDVRCALPPPLYTHTHTHIRTHTHSTQTHTHTHTHTHAHTHTHTLLPPRATRACSRAWRGQRRRAHQRWRTASSRGRA